MEKSEVIQGDSLIYVCVKPGMAWERPEDALDGLSGNFFGRYDLTLFMKCNMPKIPFDSAGKRPENSQKHVDMGEILVQVPCVG